MEDETHTLVTHLVKRIFEAAFDAVNREYRRTQSEGIEEKSFYYAATAALLYGATVSVVSGLAVHFSLDLNDPDVATRLARMGERMMDSALDVAYFPHFDPTISVAS